MIDQKKLDDILVNLMLVAHNLQQPVNSPKNGMLQGVPFIKCDQFVDLKERAKQQINGLVYTKDNLGGDK